MPYDNIKELPASIRRLPAKAQQMYKTAFNSTYAKHKKDSISSKVAWAVVKTKFKKVGDEWIAKGLGLDLYTFDLKLNDDVFVQKSASGEYYLEATLSDTMTDGQGKRFTERTLKQYANQINNHGVPGYITHSDWDDFKMRYGHLSESDFVSRARTERKGILKTVQAIYKKGKLWIKALIDKRYVNHVRKFNKVSIEALIPSKYQIGSEYDGGYVLGFALDNNAINSRATAQVVNG